MVKLRIFLLIGLCMVYYTGFSQKRYDKSLTQDRGKKHQPMKFKNNKKMAVICPIFIPSEYPYQGIGFKAGDPFALTYKLYATKWLAFSIDAGIGAYGLYKDRYAELFYTLPEPESDTTLTYFNHQVEKDTHISAKVSFYGDGPSFLRGLDYYVSLGWQFRYVDILYGYNQKISETETEFGTLPIKQVDYNGPEVGFGLEYAYFDLPISAFMEINWFYDVVKQPTFIKFQGGIGLRYVF
jgi:hypothetical protein